MHETDTGTNLSGIAARETFVAAMQQPAAYATLHAVAEPIRCIETHVSWVFLTGRDAYKVKKPLRLSFLDYSTLTRREVLCREELRLNRRHAPGLYLDVVPIGGTPDAPRVGDTTSPAFEYALRMRQFDPAEELGLLVARNAVSVAELDAFGVDLAAMHARASQAELAEGFGKPDSIHRVTEANFEEIHRALPGQFETRALAAVRSLLDAEFACVAATMARRHAAGFVREGHGDLHCGNVVRWGGRLVAFDGLEFDRALRFIDVANDLAFLTMDLAVHGRRDLRRAALDAWTRACGDYEAVGLIRYYEAARALVRAKVAALRGLQAPREGDECRSLADRYLEWAVRRGAACRPWLVAMVGLSGSGKSWLATRLAHAIDALALRSDVERKRLAGLGPLDSSRSPAGSGIYTLEFNDRTYGRLRDCAAACLKGGESAIVDAAHLRRHEREPLVKIAESCGARLAFVHCESPLAIRRRRVAERASAGTDASEATVDLLERQGAYWEPFTEDERSIVIDVDTDDERSVEAATRTLTPRAK